MIGIFFLSHILNDFTLRQYERIRKSVFNDNFEVIWIYTIINKKDLLPKRYEKEEIDYKNFFKENNINNYHILTDFPDNYFDKNNYGCPNNGYLFSKIYDDFPNYEYYWFIEYDVSINNLDHSFKPIFKYYHNLYNQYENDADLICDHLATYNSNFNYDIRYPYDDIVKKYNITNFDKKDVLIGFLTICRLSNKLLRIINDKYKNILHGFFEWLIPSIAQVENLKICTFENLFSFNCFNPNTVVIHWNERINRGLNSPQQMELYNMSNFIKFLPINCILHPIKNEDNFQLIYGMKYD